MAVGSVHKQPKNQHSWFANLVYIFATRFINLQCTRAQYPSRFPLKLLQYAAEQGHIKAMSGLGRLLYSSGACRAERRSGLEYVRTAAKSSDSDAQFVLGTAYLEDDVFTQKNKQLAIHWLALAADSGHTQAAQKLRVLAQQESESQSQSSTTPSSNEAPAFSAAPQRAENKESLESKDVDKQGFRQL